MRRRQIRLLRALLAIAALQIRTAAWAQGAGAEAVVSITPWGGIGASTYGDQSFQVTNNSPGGQRITRLRLDLRGSLLPDMVFDPTGNGGDTTSKCFTPDTGAAAVGLVSPADPCVNPFSSPHDGGFDVVQADFTGFDRFETFTFSVDVDPTSIRGVQAPGPNDSGGVSGLELTGALVEITFSDGATLSGRVFQTPGSDGASTVTIALGLPPQAGLQVLGIPGPFATVTSVSQTVRVLGPAGSPATLLRLESGLYTSGVANDGFDIDSFEANTALAYQEYPVTIGAAGYVDVPVTLTRGAPEGGFNYLVAALRTPIGWTGAPSAPAVLMPVDCTAPPRRSMTLTWAGSSLSWTLLAGATSYDVVTGDLNLLLFARSYTPSILSCSADNTAATSLPEKTVPAAGAAYYYLVRGVSCGGSGTYDEPPDYGQAGPRDAAIDAATSSCP